MKQGILEEVKEHTDWVNSCVIVEKDTGNHYSPNHTVKEKLRICLDPRDLNEALEREPYHTRSVDEITVKLQGMTFHHCRLQERLLDGSTSSRFQETHLYGTTIWQIPMDMTTNGYSGCIRHFPIQTGCHLYWHGRCHRIADDMVIVGKDKMKHDRNFLAFMEKCMSNNLTLHSKKIQLKQSQVSFYGHCCSKHWISPDPKKIQALKHMEFLPDKETMRSFLGMINYLNRYSALSAHLAAPLSALTHQATDYKPGKAHHENFN